MVFSSRIIRSIIIIIGSRLTSLQILIYLSASNDMGVGKRFQNLEALSFVNYHAAIEWGCKTSVVPLVVKRDMRQSGTSLRISDPQIWVYLVQSNFD